MSDLRSFPPSLIDEDALESGIRDLPRFGIVRYSVGTDSTQSRALDVLHDLDAGGISFVTESQDMGRGRSARRWTSPIASGLLFSTILPSDMSATSLPAVGFWSSLAIARAVASVCGITSDMKWPNDLLLGGRKCAGILCEGRSEGLSTRIVVGVGLNVNRPSSVPESIASSAAWLSDVAGAAIDRTALLVAALRAYEESFDALVEQPSAVIGEWRARSGLVGQYVVVKALDGATLHEGEVLDVAPDGSLVLKTSRGRVPVMLGDVDVLS
ncbi:MAG TPA: biotin--[acetyl-CoA-carboxylase] ligase [Candidatus Eremiobacteraceae bacterium]|nr:biotin--[acetyl-CoA-carboxylase] ligase [Candidatus Eremiobacteraceae bacterium]